MNSEEIFERQKNWSENGLFLMRSLLPLMAPVSRFEEWSDRERSTLVALLTASARSSESVMLLNAYGQLWDSEIVLRSVFEGSLKFVYLLQNKADFKERFEEYSEILRLNSLVKDHGKAKDVLDAVPNPNDGKWKPFHDMALTAEDIEEIDKLYSKSVRKSLEGKWGYTGIVGHLTRSDDTVFTGFHSLLHGYGIASHIQHADMIGASLPMDREHRSEKRKNALHFAHLARLISDAFTCLQMRLVVGYRYVNHDVTPIVDASEKISEFRKTLDVTYEEWMEIEYGKGDSE